MEKHAAAMDMREPEVMVLARSSATTFVVLLKMSMGFPSVCFVRGIVLPDTYVGDAAVLSCSKENSTQ